MRAETTRAVARRPALVLTPATRFGSWAWIEKALEEIEGEVVVVSFGRSSSAPAHVRFVSLPSFIDYGRWGVKLAERRFLLLNVLYYAPLAPLAWLTILRLRPRLLVANGVFAAAILTPFATSKRRLVLAFHGSIEHAGAGWHRVLRQVLRRVSRAFVNSTGSLADLGYVLSPTRITVIEHWADAVFFEVPLEREVGASLRVIYVGRMDSEKFTQCLRVCAPLAAAGVITLETIGGGDLASQVDGPGMTHSGYIADKRELALRYAAADVAWGAADVTYVTLPGVEALAAGCPLLIPDVPAVFTHAQAGQKVPQSLVSPDVASVVDGQRDEEAVALLRRWAETGISPDHRQACRAYAQARYSSRNIRPFVEALSE